MFGELVRDYRQRLGLTQDELADRAGVSSRNLRDVETGRVRRPRKVTVQLLADALCLSEPDREAFSRAARGVTTIVSPVPNLPRVLPRDLPDFVGREQELAALLDAARERQPMAISTIDGMAGVGKTALAVRAAHQLSADFPDGQMFVDLRGYTTGEAPVEPATALDTLLRQLGLPPGRIPHGLDERIEVWRTALAVRRVLLVLDNAASAEQVAPLLPGSGSSFVMITSRRRLVGLDGVGTVSLDALPESDALALLARVVGDSRPVAERAAALAAVRLCGRLPLAIRIAGARLRYRPMWTLAALAARLGSEPGPLGELDEPHRGVVNAFALSHRRLSPRQRLVFQTQGRHFGTDFDVFHVAAMTGLPLNEADWTLHELVDVHMLTEPVIGRFKLHDLLRDYAAMVAGDATDPATATVPDRLLDYLLYAAAKADAQLNPKPPRWPLNGVYPPAYLPPMADAAAALAWFDVEHETLLKAIRFASATGRVNAAWKLPYLTSRYWDTRDRVPEAVEVCRQVLAAVGDLPDPLPGADLLYCLARLRHHAGGESLTMNREALDRYRRVGHRAGECDALIGIGLALEAAGEYAAAIEAMTAARALATDISDGAPSVSSSAALNNLATLHGRLGRLDEAIDLLNRATEESRAIGDEHSVATNLSNIGFAYMMLDKLDTAERYLRDSLEVYERVDDTLRQADMLSQLGVVATLQGRHADALDYHEQTAALLTRVVGHENAAKLYNDRGQSQAAAGQSAAALASHEYALLLARDHGRPFEEARALAAIGELLHDRDPDGARRYLADALRRYDELGVPEADELRARIEADHH